MIAAPVGFRCPECVRQQTRSSRSRVVTRGQMRSRWEGGMLGTSGFSVTKVLVALNVVYFLVELLTGAVGLIGGGSTGQLVRLGALVPAFVTVDHEYWRMFTSMFMHAGLFHILFNMWALLVIGDYLEAAIGRLKFALLYLVSGFAGSVLVVIAAPALAPTIGASGAIYGVFGALGVYAYLNRGRDLMAQALLRNIIFLLVINLLFTFGFRGVSWQAHIGGLLGGAAMVAALMLGGRKDPRYRLDGVDLAGIILIVAALVALTWWRVTTFTL
jgi:membrane associated rhomboid family serine protease